MESTKNEVATTNTNESEKEIQKRYLSSWSYNAALILTELDKIVINNGGKMCSTWRETARPDFLIKNRSLQEATQEARKRLERVTARGVVDATPFKEELTQLELIPNDFILTCHGDFLYTSFVLNGYYYNYNLDDNPFFEFSYTKTPVLDNGKINRNFYAMNDNKKWWTDILYSFRCTHEQRHAAALEIFNMLTNSETSRPYGKIARFENVYTIES